MHVEMICCTLVIYSIYGTLVTLYIVSGCSYGTYALNHVTYSLLVLITYFFDRNHEQDDKSAALTTDNTESQANKRAKQETSEGDVTKNCSRDFK